jgi:arginyl-tRNA synthetase
LKRQLEQLLGSALSALTGTILPEPPPAGAATVERTRDPRHGEFATHVALRLAKGAGRNPRELAQRIVGALPPSPLVAGTEVAGAGFINFHLTCDAHARELASIHELGERYGRGESGAGERVVVAFVSANPTGPLHVAHGRHAVYGSAVANLLAASGYAVHRELYVNDAGRQMDILAVSAWLRYLELCGERVAFPSSGYRGGYLRPVAERLLEREGRRLERPAARLLEGLPPDAPAGEKEPHIDAMIARSRELIGADSFGVVLELALGEMLADMRNDLEQLGVTFDRWYSERSLGESGAIDRALERLAGHGRLYRRDGALWFRATDFGDEKDRVVVRENGQRTYFASDIAYHLDKRMRGFARLIDVLGADHHGYLARVRAGLAAMGEPPESLEVALIQIVNLHRGGEPVPMGKREGRFVTLRQLRAEVGNDACRLFYLMRSHDQPLDFDLELAKSRTHENPVYYIQYAHARVASVRKQLTARGIAFDRAEGLAHAALLSAPHEQAVLRSLLRYPEVLEQAAAKRAPHALVHYLRELAHAFHACYNAGQFIVDEPGLRNARLALIGAVQQVIRNGLGLLGVSAPQSM